MIGQGWMGRDGDGRLSITGWSVVNAISSSETEQDDSDEPQGWD